MDYNKLAELLFPDIDCDIDFYENKYPRRDLPEGARVTRLGPSPTGFIHLGNLYGALVDERLAHQSGGVFFLRIEDTDNKREVEGAVDIIINSLKYFNVNFDEGATVDGEKGIYGPYRQRQRREIYRCFAKHLTKKGLCYPCFCSEEENEARRTQQEAIKANPGYYGEWATCRNLSYEEVEKRVNSGESYVMRFRAPENSTRIIEVEDEIRGTLKMPENEMNFVVLKSDGIPTYHFAHLVDDYLMGTTHVVRGEEWLATLPYHHQLFEAFGFKIPVYCHTAVLMKIDAETGVKRKLSKRKDPEFSLDFYRNEGYLPEAVWEYLLTVLNSNFEEWRRDNPKADVHDFKFTTQKMSVSGALFDTDKLADVSKNYIATLDGQVVYDHLTAWAKECDEEYYNLLTKDPKFTLNMINIGRGGEKPRKDISCWRQSKEFFAFMFPETFKMEDSFPENVTEEDRKAILTKYLETYNHADVKEDWFPKLREMGEEMGFAPKPQLYKKNPDMYKGHVGDVSGVIRVALTGRMNAPDIWEIQQVLGEEETIRRIKVALN